MALPEAAVQLASSHRLPALPGLARCPFCLPSDPLSSQPPAADLLGLVLRPLCVHLAPRNLIQAPGFTQLMSVASAFSLKPRPNAPEARQTFPLGGHLLNRACSSLGSLTAMEGLAIHLVGGHS